MRSAQYTISNSRRLTNLYLPQLNRKYLIEVKELVIVYKKCYYKLFLALN